MKKSIIFCVILICSALTHSVQAQSASGKVIDLSGNGIPEVEIVVRVSCAYPFGLLFYDINTRTNADGVYAAAAAGPNCVLGVTSISKPGYFFASTSTSSSGGNYIGTNLPRLTSTSAASFRTDGYSASEMIIAAFGTELATMTEVATTTLPTTLAERSVLVKDSNGMEKPARLFFVSPSQINYLIPSGLAGGTAVVKLIADNQIKCADFIYIQSVAPSLFTANANGREVASGLTLRVKPDGSQQYEQIAQFDAAQGKFVALPIDLGAETDQVYLALFGTGWRNRNSLADVIVKVGGIEAETLYAGPQRQYPGLDQINVRLPRSLAGRGEVDVFVSVHGTAANVAKISVK